MFAVLGRLGMSLLPAVWSSCARAAASLPSESSLVPVTKTFDPSALTASAQGSSLWLPGPSKLIAQS